MLLLCSSNFAIIYLFQKKICDHLQQPSRAGAAGSSIMIGRRQLCYVRWRTWTMVKLIGICWAALRWRWGASGSRLAARCQCLEPARSLQTLVPVCVWPQPAQYSAHTQGFWWHEKGGTLIPMMLWRPRTEEQSHGLRTRYGKRNAFYLQSHTFCSGNLKWKGHPFTKMTEVKKKKTSALDCMFN